MKSSDILKKLLSDHYDGDPWIDVTLSQTFKKISTEQALKKIDNLNSIWQIVNHMISWRETLLSRVKDESITVPDNNFIKEIEDTSEKSWERTLKRFKKSQMDIISFLSDSKDKVLDKVSSASGYTYYELIQAILQHDAYHLGQIVLILKLINGMKNKKLI